MIKNLLDANGKDSTETKPAVEENAANETAAEENIAPNFTDTNDTEIPLEISEAAVAAPTAFETADDAINYELPAEAKTETIKSQDNSRMLFQTAAEPESIAETARNSGLAYGAAITLFGSVVFMLIIGWGADLLLGTSPWGIVGGIVLGAIIGFFQFFRITSQIFKK